MTTRLTCDVSDTKELLKQILIGTENDSRVMFFDEPGRGEAKMQAVRVRLSRVRNNLRNKSRKRKHFNMLNTIHPHTDESGKRWDCVVVWRKQNQRHQMMEQLEDLVGHGDVL